MITIKTKVVKNTKVVEDKKRVDDDYASTYIKRELKIND